MLPNHAGLIPTRLSLSRALNGDPVLPAKGVFAFHNVGEKFIGFFGRIATTPPLDAESAGEESGQTTHDDSHLITHDDSLVQPHAVGKVHGTMWPMAARQGSFFLWNCGFYLFR